MVAVGVAAGAVGAVIFPDVLDIAAPTLYRAGGGHIDADDIVYTRDLFRRD